MRIEGTITSETDKALQVEGVWLPRSQLSEVKIKDKRIKCIIPDWLVEQYKTGMKKETKAKYNGTSRQSPIEITNIWGKCIDCKETQFIDVKEKMCIQCRIKDGK